MTRYPSTLGLLLSLAACGDDPMGGSPDAAATLDSAVPFDASRVGDAPPEPRRIVLAVIGDYGVDNVNELNVSEMVHRWNPDHVLTTGDNNYDSGEASTIDRNIGKYYGRYIGQYRGMYGPGSPTNRFWPTIGNHDYYSIPPLQPYLDYFPALPDQPAGKRYYEVDLGAVRLFGVDSDDHEVDGYTAGSRQGMWLQAALGASSACHNLVYFHHPPYSSGLYNVAWMRWPFAAWGAHATFAGHEHFYERMRVDGIPYFISGSAGSNLFTLGPPEPRSEALNNSDFGAMRVIVTASDITYEFWAVGDRKIDSLTIVKDCPALR